jgi:hypothetical protein
MGSQQFTSTLTLTPTTNPTQSATNNNPSAQSTKPNSPFSPTNDSGIRYRDNLGFGFGKLDYCSIYAKAEKLSSKVGYVQHTNPLFCKQQKL